MEDSQTETVRRVDIKNRAPKNRTLLCIISNNLTYVEEKENKAEEIFEEIDW